MRHFEDGGEIQEAPIGRVELVEPREEAPAALESPEQPFDLVAMLAGFPVIFPFGFPVRLRRHDRRHSQVADEPAGLVALAGAVHRQRRARDRIDPALRQGAAFGRVVGLAAGQAKNHCLPVTCGDHVDLRVPSAARFSDALRPVRLSRAGAVGMHLGAGAVEAEAVRVPAVQAVTPDEGKREEWMDRIREQLNAGQVAQVIAIPEPHRRRSEAVAACIRTCEANADRMQCDLYRTRGLPVGSDVVESACKKIVGNRFKKAGCRWSKAGANALLAARWLPRKQALARLPRVESLSRRSRVTKENGMHPYSCLISAGF